jgi:hypothetical protein
MASSISAARAALYDMLSASSLLNGVQVTYGAPDAHEDPEVVALLGVRDPDEEPAALGYGRKEETYQLEVGVKSHKRDGSAAEVDTRAYELADAIADTVEGSGNYTLNSTVDWAYVAGGIGVGAQSAEGGGWVCFLTVLVTCRARIDRRRP